MNYLSHMKGGPSIEVLLDLALADDTSVATPAAEVLKTQVFLYDADTSRLEEAFKAGNAIAKDILESYAKQNSSLNYLILQKKLKLLLILPVKVISQPIYYLQVIKRIHVLTVSYTANV